MITPANGEDDLPSKSSRKRDAQAVLDLAKALVDLSDRRFAGFSLDEEIREAAALARSIRAYGGRKRQIQFLAKLMRNADLDAIRDQFQAIEDHSSRERRRHHLLEQWRDRLLDEGDACFNDLLEQWPAADRQHIRQLLRNAKREAEQSKPPRAARALFQYLRSLDEA